MDAVQRSLFRAVMREGRRFDHQFRMPAIQELWGSGVYQQQKTHEKGLQRLLPQELRPLVGGGGPVVLGREELCSRRSSNPSPNSSVSSPSTPGRPARLFRRKDVLKWIMEEEVGLGPFEVLKALRQQSKLATCASERETNGLLVEMVTGYSPQVSDEN